MTYYLILLIIFLLIVILVLLLIVVLRIAKHNNADLSKQLRNDFSADRLEMIQSGKDLRMEVMQQIGALSKTLSESIANNADMQYKQLHQFPGNCIR